MSNLNIKMNKKGVGKNKSRDKIRRLNQLPFYVFYGVWPDARKPGA